MQSEIHSESVGNFITDMQNKQSIILTLQSNVISVSFCDLNVVPKKIIQ